MGAQCLLISLDGHWSPGRQPRTAPPPWKLQRTVMNTIWARKKKKTLELTKRKIFASKYLLRRDVLWSVCHTNKVARCLCFRRIQDRSFKWGGGQPRQAPKGQKTIVVFNYFFFFIIHLFSTERLGRGGSPLFPHLWKKKNCHQHNSS